MPPITCHILDTTTGRPAANVLCELSYLTESNETIVKALTNSDGRVTNWEGNHWVTEELKPGTFRVKFHTFDYFQKMDRETFFPFVDIVFQIGEVPDNHYHIPLLLSNYGYSTYRGS